MYEVWNEDRVIDGYTPDLWDFDNLSNANYSFSDVKLMQNPPHQSKSKSKYVDRNVKVSHNVFSTI